MSETTYYSLNQTHIASNIDATGEYTIPHISVLRDAKNNLTNTISSVSSTIESHLSSVSSTLSTQVSNLNYEYDVGGGKLISRIEQVAGKISVNTRDIMMSDISNVAVISTDFFDEGIHSRLGFKLKDKRLYFGPYEYTDGQLTSQVSDLISFDCTDFIKDGMLMEVSCVNENPTTVPPTEGTFLRLTWNTDSGHDVIYVDVKKVIGGLYQGVAPYITVDGLNISLNTENLKSNNETGLSGYNELHRYYRWLAGLEEYGDIGVIATLSTEVDVIKDLNNKGLKLVGHLQYRPDVSELTFKQWLAGGGICTDKIPNGSYLPLTISAVGIDPDRTILSTSDGLVLGNGDITIVHSHSNDQYIKLDDLVVGENVFVQKCGTSRYEYQKLVDDLGTTSSWIDSKFGAFPDNSSILDAKVDVRVSGDLSVSNLFVDTISAVNLSIGQIDFKDGNNIVSVITNLKEDKGIVQLTAETLVPAMISGLREELDKLSCTVTICSALSDFDALSGINTGDIAIVSVANGVNPLSSGYSVTGHIWRSDISNWVAMNGNYNAKNIYFDYDITTAGAWEKLGNISHTANTVSSMETTDKSLAEIMDMIFKGEELFPSVPSPSCNITLTSYTYEVGTNATIKFTLKFDPLTYEYGTNTNTNLNSTTGVSATNYRLTYQIRGRSVSTKTGEWATNVTDTTFQVSAGTNCSGGNLSVWYGAAGDGLYIPRTNLERVLSSDSELNTYKVKGGHTTKTSTSNSIVGYYPNFYGFKGGTTGNQILPQTGDRKIERVYLSSSVVRGLGNTETSNPNASTGCITPKTSINATQSWSQFFYAIPHGLKSNLGVINGSLPLTINKVENISVTHQNGVTSNYDVFYSAAADNFSPDKLTLTWS